MLSTLGSYDEWQWLRILKPPIALLAGPALYLYVTSIRQKAVKPTPRLWLHLLPAVAGIVLMSTTLGRGTDLYLNLCIGGYWIMSAVYFLRHREHYRPKTVARFVQWLIVIFGTVYILDVILSYQAQQDTGYRHLPAYTAGLAALLAGAGRMIWTALKNSSLLVTPESGIKYARTGLSDREMDVLAEHFEILMGAEEAFKGEDVSLKQVALTLDAQPRHLSQMVNSRYGQNFSSHINQRRVKLAANRLCAAENNRTPITKIMYDVGFQSKSTFNREFRHHLGVSPKEYRAKMQPNS
jgi:AraC-like DNA-binding protein